MLLRLLQVDALENAARHGNATLLDQIGVPMAVRQNRLGHAVTADERRTADELGKILQVTARNEQQKGPAPEALTQMIQ